MPSLMEMAVEVAAAAGRRPRELLDEECERTLAMQWAALEAARHRPMLNLISWVFPPEEEAPAPGPGKGKPLPGGRHGPPARPPPGGRLNADGALVIHIDDPMAMAAFRGTHPAQARAARGSKG